MENIKKLKKDFKNLIQDFADQEYHATLYNKLFSQTINKIYIIEDILSNELNSDEKIEQILNLIKELYHENDVTTLELEEIKERADAHINAKY